MKPSTTKNNNFFPYILLFVQPIFMATNIIVARGGVEYVPPISLAFWRWFFVFLILLPFFYSEIYKKKKFLKKEFYKLFFLGLMGCGVCGRYVSKRRTSSSELENLATSQNGGSEDFAFGRLIIITRMRTMLLEAFE